MKKKTNLDERQEQKLLEIERNAFWLAFTGLLIAIVVATALTGGMSFRVIAGEVAVMLVLCAYIVVACLKHGIWDRNLKPTLKANLLISLIPGVVVGALWFGISYYNYRKPVGSLATAAFCFLLTSGLTFALMSLCTKLYKNRVKKLEDIEED